MIMRDVVVLILLVTALLTVVGSVLYYRSMERQADSLRMRALSATADKLDAALGQFEYCSTVMVSNRQLVRRLIARRAEVLTGDSGDQWSRYQQDSELRALIRDLGATANIYAVGVYMDDIAPQYMISIMKDDLYDLEPIETAVKAVRAQPDIVRWVSAFNVGHGTKAFAIVRSLRAPDTLEVVGAFALLVDTDHLESLLTGGSRGAEAGNLYLADDSGTVVVSTDGARPRSLEEFGLYASEMEGVEGFVRAPQLPFGEYLFAQMDRMGWRLVAASDNRPLLAVLSNTLIAQPLIALFCLIVAFFVTRAMARRIDFALSGIMWAMRRVADGELAEIREGALFRETDQLGVFLNATVQRLKDTLNMVYEKELMQKEAEFDSLQAQINPHFFYNTLETINMLLLVDGRYDLSEMVVNLADILRFNISGASAVITVGEEVELIRKYLAIMRERFSDRLVCEIDLPDEVREVRIVKLMIQPLVENAIIHGMENTADPCHIRISGRIEAGRLIITIEDDGVGIDPAVAAAIMDGSYKGGHEGRNGVGIGNILSRIRLYYGEGYGIALAPGASRGTQAILYLPCEKRKRRNSA